MHTIQPFQSINKSTFCLINKQAETTLFYFWAGTVFLNFVTNG